MTTTALKLIGLVLITTLMGCASTEYAQYSKAQVEIATAKHNADTAKYNAFAAIAQQGDATAKVAAVMAMALGSNSTGVQSDVQAPQPNQALQWASILVPSITQVAGMRYNYLSQQTASNNATALGLSTNSAFVGLASRIQAPGSTTTTTLSGTGNLGSGTYSLVDRNDVTTTTTQAAPIVPVVQVVPTVIQPVEVTPVIQVTPTIIPPVTQTVATVTEVPL